MQTQTPHNIHRDGQEDSEGDRDDRYNQPKTIQSQSNSVITVIRLSLPPSLVLRPEHVNQGKAMSTKRAAWDAVCVHKFGKDRPKHFPGHIWVINPTSLCVPVPEKEGAGRYFLF